jgi:hypothetical protein
LPELELLIARPPMATATAAAPAATNLVSLREDIESTPVVRWEYTEPGEPLCVSVGRRLGCS